MLTNAALFAAAMCVLLFFLRALVLGTLAAVQVYEIDRTVGAWNQVKDLFRYLRSPAMMPGGDLGKVRE